MRRFMILFLLFPCLATYGQGYVCQPADSTEFLAKKELLSELKGLDLPERMFRIGQSFLGKPYLAGTLEGNPEEVLVVNLQGLDCTTLVENILAFGRLSYEQDLSFRNFRDRLQAIRYRGGIRQGYSSRLHYFSEWLADKERMGMLRDLTKELGGATLDRQINFMSKHRDLYPGLSPDSEYQAILETEMQLSRRDSYYLPSGKVKAIEPLLQEGDLVAMVSRVEGLDVSHTGILVRQENGRIHLLHASSNKEKVVLSEQPLSAYLRGQSQVIGILVARPLPPVSGSDQN